MPDEFDMVTKNSVGQDPDPVTEVVDPEADVEDPKRRDKLDKLAVKLQKSFEKNPALTINIAASTHSEKMKDVEEILDSYQVDEEGNVAYVGKGQGHGWAPPAEMRMAEPVHLGYRWPDDSIRPEPFDVENAEHRDEMGITF